MDQAETYIRARQLARAEIAREQLRVVFDSLKADPDERGAITHLFAGILGKLSVAIQLLEEREQKAP